MSAVSAAPAPKAGETQSDRSTFNVGTRKSALALVQTNMVTAAAAGAFPNYTFATKARDTAAGDIDKVTPFKDMAVKNIWTHELETLLIEGHLDVLVHSLKGTSATTCARHPAKQKQIVQHNSLRVVRLVASSSEKTHEMPW